MKTWIKRSLIGLTVATVLVGGLAVAHGAHHWRHMSEADIAQMKTRMVERIGSKLALDATQKAKLDILADQLQAQRLALRGSASAEPKAELQSLIAGTTFDRAKASSLLNAKIGAVQAQAPGVLSAAADFFDSLRPEQQAQVRDFLARGRQGGWGHHGPNGAAGG